MAALIVALIALIAAGVVGWREDRKRARLRRPRLVVRAT